SAWRMVCPPLKVLRWSADLPAAVGCPGKDDRCRVIAVAAGGHDLILGRGAVHPDLNPGRRSIIPPDPFGSLGRHLPIVDVHALLQTVGLSGLQKPLLLLCRVEVDEHVLNTPVLTGRPNA